MRESVRSGQKIKTNSKNHVTLARRPRCRKKPCKQYKTNGTNTEPVTSSRPSGNYVSFWPSLYFTSSHWPSNNTSTSFINFSRLKKCTSSLTSFTLWHNIIGLFLVCFLPCLHKPVTTWIHTFLLFIHIFYKRYSLVLWMWPNCHQSMYRGVKVTRTSEWRGKGLGRDEPTTKFQTGRGLNLKIMSRFRES